MSQIRFVFLLLVIFSSLSLNVKLVQATAAEYSKEVVIINQVRGAECCDAGSLALLRKTYAKLEELKLPATFVLRYDALLDPDYQAFFTTLPSTYEIGAFLEITPSLASASGVAYKGTSSNWYEAQHAYTVGYELKDRKKIIDQYMHQFFKVFGYYPKTTTAWVMDTDSIAYLHKRYGVIAHQITREQWGTDSYTLSGGPIHYPYQPSKNWVFLKDSQSTAGPLILRQTGSDPLLNYGDPTSSFTTQPNDYTRDGKNIEYFTFLATELLNQDINRYGFLLLGLENSLSEEVHTEFQRQLTVLQQDTEIEYHTAADFARFYQAELAGTQPVTVVHGTDFFSKAVNPEVAGVSTDYYRAWLLKQSRTQAILDWQVSSPSLVNAHANYKALESALLFTPMAVPGTDVFSKASSEVLWVSTDYYRVRLLRQGGTLSVTDWRVFSPDLVDPYTQYKALKSAFWITPMVVHGEHHYNWLETISLLNLFDSKKIIQLLQQYFLPEYQEKYFEVALPKNDLYSNPESVMVATVTDTPLEIVRLEDGAVQVSTATKDTKKVTVVFKNMSIEVIGSENISTVSNPLFSKNCAHDNYCEITLHPPSNEVFNQLREQSYSDYFPELRPRELDPEKTILYAHNQYAVVRKNPVRFVLIPKDKNGFSTVYPNKVTVEATLPVVSTVHEQQPNGTTFIDVTSETVGRVRVDIQVGEQVKKTATVYFTPDCANEPLTCIVKPQTFLWYMQGKALSKLRLL
jgi:hypothetical protein